MFKHLFILTLIFLSIHSLNAQIINIEDKRMALGDSIKLKGFGGRGLFVISIKIKP